jgi:hypothetical protein
LHQIEDAVGIEWLWPYTDAMDNAVVSDQAAERDNARLLIGASIICNALKVGACVIARHRARTGKEVSPCTQNNCEYF